MHFHYTEANQIQRKPGKHFPARVGLARPAVRESSVETNLLVAVLLFDVPGQHFELSTHLRPMPMKPCMKEQLTNAEMPKFMHPSFFSLCLPSGAVARLYPIDSTSVSIIPMHTLHQHMKLFPD
jgi:hypothetical protein